MPQFLVRAVAFLTVTLALTAQTPAPNFSQDTPIIRLWEQAAPRALGTADVDIPTLTYYPAAKATSTTTVIIAPGGSYHALASNHEGRQVANFLNAAGLNVFVLKYRLGPKYHHPVELGDIQRAIRLVRARAAQFHISPDRLGVMGFSAGGHLASSASTHFDAGNPKAPDPIDRLSSRPDFAILIYPVISLTAPYTHQGSLHNLLGNSPDPQLARQLSSELAVTPQTPPTFLFTTSDDIVVPVENSVAYYLALHKASVPAELHIFQNGAHGAGLALSNPSLSAWPALLLNWLRLRGLIS